MCDNFENGNLVEGPEETCEAPHISWEWNPVDDAEFGDGILVVTAKGNGFVMLEVDDRSRTGEDEASMNIKAEIGQKITARAYIAVAGSAVSPIAEETYVVPGMDQPSDPEPKDDDAPVMIFGDNDGNPINEITLAPGEKQTIRIILEKHPARITNAFQAQWIMRDSKHQPTETINCAMSSNSGEWIHPLNLSTVNVDQGGRDGNTMKSAKVDSATWRCIGANFEDNQFWHPLGEHMPPIAVARFIIEAPSDWKDKYATFELDNDFTLFVLTDDYRTGYRKKCNYKMALTIKNKNPQSGDDTGSGSDGDNGEKPAVEPNNAPVLTFADENDQPIDHIYLAPGEKKKVRIVLSKHPEPITKSALAFFYAYDSKHQLTNDITCLMKGANEKTLWLKPLSLSTDNPNLGGLNGNRINTLYVEENSQWSCILTNMDLNRVWQPRGPFMPPIAVAQFTIWASSDWDDEYATFELAPEKTTFVLAPNVESTNKQYTATCYYNMVLTVKNKNKLPFNMQ